MSLRIAINGFGRIGRVLFRVAFGHPDIEIVAINDLADAATLAHLLKYDSSHGIFSPTVEAAGDALVVDGIKVRVLRESDPARLPWKEMSVDLAVEATGFFTDRPSAQKHLAAGAGRVVISAPAKDPDVTVVLGVNADSYDPARHRIVSNASCTTNCLAPVAKLLLDRFGIVHGMMTTIHSYTNDQTLLDMPHKDLRRARAGGVSMIPTTTGAAKALGDVIPALGGKITGMAIRVPTPNVSLIDLVVALDADADEAAVKALFVDAAQNAMKGILEYTEAPLVSVDLNGNPHSAIVDGTLTRLVGRRMLKVIAWYDNEWAYACRVRDLVLFLGASHDPGRSPSA